MKKRFPDLQHLVETGLLREDEYKVNIRQERAEVRRFIAGPL